MKELVSLIASCPSPYKHDILRDIDPDYYVIEKDPHSKMDYSLSVRDDKIDAVGGQNFIRGRDGFSFWITRNVFLQQRRRDKDAYYVSQGKVGYVLDDKIGTTNVHSCLAFIFQDKRTKTTALAHISAGIGGARMLREVRKNMPEGDKLVILIGDRYGYTQPSLGRHLTEVMEFLSAYPHDIYIDHSYIHHGEHIMFPQSVFSEYFVSCYETNTNFGNVMFDPRTGEVTSDYPTGDMLYGFPKNEGSVFQPAKMT